MNCPACGAADYYDGGMGPNCLTPSCTHFRNGKLTGQPARAAAEAVESEWSGFEVVPGITLMDSTKPVLRPHGYDWLHIGTHDKNQDTWFCVKATGAYTNSDGVTSYMSFHRRGGTPQEALDAYIDEYGANP